jgi:NAD(P)-dependent dehydrogenase (short-subunit alcohol dehydrogenase family)
MRFTDKIVLVVGGNSGIGLASAKSFAEEGATVFLTGRNRETLESAAAEIGYGATPFQSDIADIESLAPVIDAIRAAHGRIDVLFVNAGVGGFAGVRDVTPAMWDEVHGINLRGCFFAVQQALPLIGRGGSIVLTGSIGAVLGVPGNVVYAAAKAGLRAAARILATELVKEGVRVNVISPGPTETPIINRNPGMSADDVAGLRAAMISAVPMKRMGEADEIARAVLFLASADSSFITGIDLFVDGGCVEL